MIQIELSIRYSVSKIGEDFTSLTTNNWIQYNKKIRLVATSKSRTAVGCIQNRFCGRK